MSELRKITFDQVYSAMVTLHLAKENYAFFLNSEDDFKEKLASIGENEKYFVEKIQFAERLAETTLETAIMRGEFF